MRLLPPSWEGLHEVFPEPADARIHNSQLLEHLPFAAFLGVTRFCIGVLGRGISKSSTSRKSLPWAAAGQITAYSAVGLLVAQGLAIHTEWHAAGTFLQQRGIRMPRQQLADRLTCIDADNFFIAGGLAGILVAARQRHPWAISGWKRTSAAFTFGAAAGCIVGKLYHVLNTTPEERQKSRERAQNRRVQQKKWSSMVFDYSFSFDVTQPAENPSLAGYAMKATGSPTGEILGGSARSSGTVALGSAPGGDGSENVGRNGPHLTTTIPDEQEPVPFANTNYAWTTDNAVDDLERHIKALQQRRQRLAHEAEFIWAWLSEKEAEYYNNPEFDPKQESKERFFLEFLGSHHTKTWLEASSCDWMIADATKRIAQIRSKLVNGNVDWLAGCSDAAAKTEPKFAMMLLRGFEQAMLQMQNQLESAKAQTSVEMADSTSEFDVAVNEQVYNPVKQRMTTQKEMMLDVLEQVDKALQQTVIMKQAASEIIAEGEERVRTGAPTKTR